MSTAIPLFASVFTGIFPTFLGRFPSPRSPVLHWVRPCCPSKKNNPLKRGPFMAVNCLSVFVDTF